MASLVFTSKSFKYLIRCEHAALWPDVSGVYARVRLAHSGLWAHLGGGIAPLLHRGAPPPPARIPKRGVLQTLGITPPPPPYLYHWDFFFFFTPQRGGHVGARCPRCVPVPGHGMAAGGGPAAPRAGLGPKWSTWLEQNSKSHPAPLQTNNPRLAGLRRMRA